jgi:hypothetical protein
MLNTSMKLAQTIAKYLSGFLLILPLFTIAFFVQPALAYKCTGQTGDLQHYYKNGACYSPAGNTCLDNPPPTNSADCKNRDTSKDTKVNGELPVKNDGSQITDWECTSGTYNQKKQVCENCNAFGSCQTLANVTPTPKGADTTTDPSAQGSSSNSNGSSNSSSSTTKDDGGKGTCAGEKTDFFACGASGSDAIVAVLKIIIFIVSVGVGIIAVGGIVFGAILYAGAQDNQEQIRKGITIIRSVIIGLVLYIFMVAIINFLVPGGVFSDASNANSNNCSTTNNSNNSNSSNTNGQTPNQNCSNRNSNSSTNTNGTNSSTNGTNGNSNQNTPGNNQKQSTSN